MYINNNIITNTNSETVSKIAHLLGVPQHVIDNLNVSQESDKSAPYPFDSIRSLIDSGLISHDETQDSIMLHPEAAAKILEGLEPNSEDSGTAAVYEALGCICFSDGRYSDALKAFERARESFGLGVNLFYNYYLQGRCYCRMEDYDAAEDCYNDALDEIREFADGDFEEYGYPLSQIYIGLAELSCAQDENVQAMFYCKQAIEHAQDGDVESRCRILKILADAYHSIDSIRLTQERLELCRSHFGETHPMTADAYSDLGEFYYEIDPEADANGENFTHALKIRRELFGSYHHVTAKSYYDLAWWHVQRRNIETDEDKREHHKQRARHYRHLYRSSARMRLSLQLADDGLDDID